MNEDRGFEGLFHRVRILGVQSIAMIIDSLFLGSWVAIHYFTNQIINKISLNGFDHWILSIFQMVFAVSTLVPVVAYIYQDLRLIISKACKN